MHEQAIIDELLAHLDTDNCVIHPISLTCSPQTLRERLQKDIDAGLRQPDILQRSVVRLPFYKELGTEKICTDGLKPDEIADIIMDRACTDKKNG